MAPSPDPPAEAEAEARAARLGFVATLALAHLAVAATLVIVTGLGLSRSIAPPWMFPLGVAVDCVSFLLFSVSVLGRQHEIAIPLVGWLCYAIACALTPRTVLFAANATGALLVAYKLGEWLLLVLFHVTMQFLLPRLVLRLAGRLD
jgi:hypothetical protein